MTTVGCVVLTRGQRPSELARGLESVLSQRDVDVNVAVVGNGWEPVGLPPGVRAVGLQVNLGIPAGRNAGVPRVEGEFLLFLDDDAALATPDFLVRCVQIMTEEPLIAVVQPRPVDPVTGQTPRSFVPRLRVGDPGRSSDITALWEGAIVVRRSLFDRIGGWPALYYYGHEGVELAWRVMDSGHRCRYVGDLHAWHDAKNPGRVSFYYYQQARNRIWLARRNLPMPFAVCYVLTWVLLTLVRARDVAALRDSARGWAAGLREPCGERRPIKWRTVWAMARAGRPPVI